MSMMGKISFFLGLQISQSPRGIFINQSKYALESLKKYGYESCEPMILPWWIEVNKQDDDKEGTAARPTEKHLNAVKRIFRYLKGTVHRGLWYPKDSSFALTAFADADHAGCQDTRRKVEAMPKSAWTEKDQIVTTSVKERRIGDEYQKTDHVLKLMKLIRAVSLRFFQMPDDQPEPRDLPRISTPILTDLKPGRSRNRKSTSGNFQMAKRCGGLMNSRILLYHDDKYKFKEQLKQTKSLITQHIAQEKVNRYSQTSKAYIVLNKETMRIEESLNVTFDEGLLEPKSSSLVEDDR
ncbi:hypothetical protein Tco_0585981 [Tanacetum coccineum]